jgi:hypothetical protein
MARLLNTVLATCLIASAGDSRGYAISGIIRDTHRQPLQAARIEVIAPGFEGRYAVSDAYGRYRIPDLTGGVRLEVSSAGFFSAIRALAPVEDTVVDFVLQPLRYAAIGESISGTLTPDSPICFGQGYEETGPESGSVACHRLLVTASNSGTLEVVLTWDRHEGLALDLIAPDGQSSQAVARSGRAHVTTPVNKGSTYEVRVLVKRETLSASQHFALITGLR